MDARPGTDEAEARTQLALMRRVSVVMLLSGGLTGAVGVWTTQETGRSRLAYAIVAGLFALWGLVLAVVARPARRTLESTTFASMALLGVLIATSDPLGMAVTFYLWPVVLLAYFSSPRVTIAGCAFAISCLGAGLVFNDVATLRVDKFIGTTSSVGLMAWLITWLGLKEDRLRTSLATAAESDPLTGLLNRRAFCPRFETMVADAVHNDAPLALVMFDLDHFKTVNDRFGHAVGDEALRHAARALDSTCREKDIVGRIGGEEFAVALPGATPTDALEYVARAAKVLSVAPDPVGTLLTSAGVCSLQPTVTTPDALLLRADEALYAAKLAGRNRAAVWEDGAMVAGEPLVLAGVADPDPRIESSAGPPSAAITS